MAAMLPRTNQFSPPYDVSVLREMPPVQKAFAYFRTAAQKITDEHIRICEIPAPPFQEAERGEYIEKRFRELGLSNVHTDAEGNVLGFYHGMNATPLIAISAHLDTVFPAATDVRVHRYASRLIAPGIGDNTAGLIALIALIEALNAGQVQLNGSLCFVATVGEEGEGDLRGARHLFTDGAYAKEITHFISLDGPGNEFITHQALGSRRYRIILSGPGGHSWTDFGTVNPIHALARAVSRLAEFPVPYEPRTTYNVGRIIGGDSVNVIPEQASIDVDIRSTDEREIGRVEDFLLSAINQAVRAENSMRAASNYTLKLDVNLIGHRPSGLLAEDDPLVQTAYKASQILGFKPFLNCASTDSNIPISLGIPAITIGAGGKGGDAHRLSEWFDPTGRELGLQRILLTLLGLTGLSD